MKGGKSERLDVPGFVNIWMEDQPEPLTCPSCLGGIPDVVSRKARVVSKLSSAKTPENATNLGAEATPVADRTKYS